MSGDSVQLRNKKRCRVLFSYQPLHDDELELKVDQVLEFMGEVEDGWWKGRSAGRVGVFPSNFVEMCTDDNASKSVNVQESSKKPHDELPQSPPPTDNPKPMSASQRSQIGQDSPAPDTVPRLPPKPGNYHKYSLDPSNFKKKGSLHDSYLFLSFHFSYKFL